MIQLPFVIVLKNKLFLLNDGSVAIIDYESVFDRENYVKYLGYVARIVKRYAVNHQLGNLKRIRVIIIYTADVEKVETIYDLGGVIQTIEAAYLNQSELPGNLRENKKTNRE